MKYEYIGESKRILHASEGEIILIKGKVFDTKDKIRHPLIINYVERKNGGRYVKVTK